jgi:hypothetical protein
MPFGTFLLVTITAFKLFRGSQTQIADTGTILRKTGFGISSQIPNQHDFIQHNSSPVKKCDTKQGMIYLQTQKSIAGNLQG